MVSDKDLAEYNSFLNRRKRWEAEEGRQIHAMVRNRHEAADDKKRMSK
jgi:hypothetical protein